MDRRIQIPVILALVAFGIWGLAANRPITSPSIAVSTTLPAAFPTTTVYHSPLDDGGGQILFPGSGMLEFVADGPAGLLAGGSSILWIAKDGESWEYVVDSTETFENVRLTGLLGDMDGYTAAGISAGSEDWYQGTPMVWTSSDAIHWLPAEGLPDIGGIHRLVRLGTDLVVALGWEGYAPSENFPEILSDVTNPRIWISADGRAWEEATIDPGQGAWFSDVAWDGEELVLGGSKDFEGRLWTSPDRGLTWELVEDPGVKWPTGHRFVAIAGTPGPAAFAITAGSAPSFSGNTALWQKVFGTWVRSDETTNHANWITWSPSAGLISGQTLSYQGPGNYWLVESEVLTSDDGRTWAKPKGFPKWQHFGRAVDVNGTVLIPGMVGDQPALWQWPDRPHEVSRPMGPWVERLTFSAEPNNWQVVPWPGRGPMVKAGGDWFRLGDTGSGEPLVFEGAQPVWVSEPIATSAAWVMSGSVEIGQSLWRSVDGTHWVETPDLLAAGGFLYGVYELNGLIVASGRDLLGHLFRATSADGLSWDFDVPQEPGFNEVLKTSAGYVGLRYGYSDPTPQISFSSDGLSWQVIPTLPQPLDIYLTPLGLMGVSGDGKLYELAPDLSSATQLDTPFEARWIHGSTSTGMVVSTRDYPYDAFWYTEDLETWVELPLNLEGGFPGVNPQFIGGDPLLVAGWDRGAVKIWEFSG